MPIVIGGIVNPPPFAPLLVSPANASYTDLAGTPTFTWTYQPSVEGNTQTGWSFHRKSSGATSYQWWNIITGAWQSTQVFNTGSIQSYQFPSGAWVDGNVWNWSVSTQDVNGTGNYAPDDTVVAQAGPTVTVTAPGGTVADAQPTVQWAPSVPVGATQTSYRVIIYGPAQYGATGFTPGAGPSEFDTGQVGSAYVTQVPVVDPTFLADGTIFRAYVQITETGGQISPWAYSAFTTNYEQPALPLFTATPGTDPVTTAPMVTLIVNGQDNILSAVDADPTTGTGTWAPVFGSCSLAPSSSGLVMTAVSTTAMAAVTAGNLYPVTPGDTYTAMASFKAGSTGRACNVSLDWYTSSGGYLSQVNGTTVTDTTTGTVQSIAGGMAPVGAAYAAAAVDVASPASGEAHTISDISLAPGTHTVPTAGGLVGITTASITYSDDNGSTWWPLRNGTTVPIPTASQEVTVIDYESPPGYTREYQALVGAVI